MSAKALLCVITAAQVLGCAAFKLPAQLRPAVEPHPEAQVQLEILGPAQRISREWQACELEASRELNILGSRAGPLKKHTCAPASSTAFTAFGLYVVTWVVVAMGVCLVRHLKGWEDEVPCERDLQWDRARYHLMTVIIWTHWLGKWGLSRYRAGWAFLTWAFSFHVIGFVFLSGVFSRRYALASSACGQLTQVAKRCLDLFLVYVIFSWLRGVVYSVLEHPPSVHVMLWAVLDGTFKFHQGPWYIGALTLWRLSTLALWWTPLSLVVALVVAVLCPYQSLDGSGDPYAIREVLHYLPYFTLGLLCGHKRLEAAMTCLGRMTPLVGLLVLLVLAALIWFPLGWVFDEPALRWMFLKKAVPPTRAGGVWTMLVLYAVKMLSTISALMVFSSPCGVPFLDKTFETVGRRSMTVYLVHMVFILEPGDSLCLEHHLSAVAKHSGLLVSIVLLALAVAVNLLCGSVLTVRAFRPLTEPLNFLGELADLVRGHMKASGQAKVAL